VTNPIGREDRLARLTPEQRAAFEARTRGRAAVAPEAGDAARAATDTTGGPIRPSPGPAPLSFGQERLWFLEQLAPGLGVHNEYVALRLVGGLDVAALDAALGDLVTRHEALRTVVDPGDGAPVQRVLPPPGSVLRVVDAPAGDAEAAEGGAQDGVTRAERALAEEEAARPFDLSQGPLFRALLIRSTPERALLVVVNHHVVGDAWSRSVLVDDLCTAYRARLHGAAPAGWAALAVQYGDWAAWQRESLTDESLAEDLSYWRQRLADAPPLLDLATDRPRPASPTHRGGRVRFTLDERLTEAVESLARAAKATPFMVTLAAWQAVLMRHSGQGLHRLGEALVQGEAHPAAAVGG
jgi:hypothetical protein